MFLSSSGIFSLRTSSSPSDCSSGGIRWCAIGDVLDGDGGILVVAGGNGGFCCGGFVESVVMKSMGECIGGRIIVVDGRGGNGIFGSIRFCCFRGFCWSLDAGCE